ncbi:hypothetical protein NDU88_000222 [Pleurodeles waltl]|uniref:Uncharacterized protein n=1 Tax=Pleurodeles waltl TaxID=8319 RepID=A0AAV7TEX2_PLEWA|nr:hypothetical protein NDU88_000222 [Pleurodeles waltl]
MRPNAAPSCLVITYELTSNRRPIFDIPNIEAILQFFDPIRHRNGAASGIYVRERDIVEADVERKETPHRLPPTIHLQKINNIYTLEVRTNENSSIY